MCAQPMDSALQSQAPPLLAEPQSSAASQTALSCVSTPKPCKPSPSFRTVLAKHPVSAPITHVGTPL